MTGECTRYQVVLMGSGKCGKSTIIQNYLFGTASEKYKETVEELYSQRYTFNGRRTYVDFLDTAGNIPFPSMQEIYINKACGFILVYSITDQRSFCAMKQVWAKIKEARTDVLNIPCVVIGNNLDNEELREVERFEALSWCYGENLGGCLIELSATKGHGIDSIINILLQQFGNRRAPKWKPESVMQITKDGTNKAINKKEKKKKHQTDKNVREVNINVGSQNICYNDIVFDEYSKKDIQRRNTDEVLRMDRIEPLRQTKTASKLKSKGTVGRHSCLVIRMASRMSKWMRD